jgi:FixJ family two-component response regulator
VFFTFTSVENFNSFEDYLQRNEGVRAAVVIDDVEIGDWDRLSNSLAQYGDRIRVVTIGPIADGRSVSREGVLEVPTPIISEDVVRVIQSSEFFVFSRLI